MDPWTEDSEAAFSAYVDSLIEVVGHADRAAPLKDYCLGLLMPGERKSVEPLAAVTSPARVGAAPVVAAFCWPGALVRHGASEAGARSSAAGDRA